MQKVRRYGEGEIRVVVVHGGPGAAGGMQEVGRELGKRWGVLEPWQTAMSVAGQVAELAEVIRDHAAGAVRLVGHSWGAWLSMMVAAEWPGLVAKLVLVGCGPMEVEYAAGIMGVRLGRLSEDERAQVEADIEIMEGRADGDEDAALGRFGKLLGQADMYDSIRQADAVGACSCEIFEAVWPEAAAMRKSGQLLEIACKIRCPVVAIHGDYDPHPAAGVREPLAKVVQDFRFVLLEKCGHKPWAEREARDEFYGVLERELG